MVMLKKGLSSSMNAKISGKGEEVIVLAHGYGADQSFWENIVPFLEKNHQVIVFDWNFSGSFNNEIIENNNYKFDAKKYDSLYPFADDLVNLLDEMKIKSCVYVAHSMAGMIGCIASIKRPHLFNKLILIGASPRYQNAEEFEGGFEGPQIEQLLSTIETNFYSWAQAFAPIAIGGKDPIIAKKFEASLTKMKPEIALDVAKIIFYGDYRDILEKIETPCIIINTTNDLVAPSSVPYYMQKKMINAKSRIEIIDVDGHFPHLTALNEFLNVLNKALDFSCV